MFRSKSSAARESARYRARTRYKPQDFHETRRPDHMPQLDTHIEPVRTQIDPAFSLTHTLREAARHGERAVLLCSFQKEESVLLDELLRLNEEMSTTHPAIGKSVRIVTIDTGVLFPETLETWRAFEQRFGVEIEVQDAS